MHAPVLCRWEGDSFQPVGRHKKDCDGLLVVGRLYRLEILEERSAASHNHQFAWLTEAWRNLPDDLADLYPSPEHLRKRALIEAGFYNETILDVGSKVGALRVATTFRARDEFLLVIVRGSVVVIREAKSQRVRGGMDKKEFQAAKSAIMEIVSQMLGVTPEKLQHETGRAA